MTLESNILADNGAEDPIGGGNWNRTGFLFQNVSGKSTITMNNNQVWATELQNGELAVVGPDVPVFKGSGNQIFPNWVVTMQGQPQKLALP